MTARIRWVDGVISVAEPAMISVCSKSGVIVGSGLVLPLSPCHTTDGLKSLSKKMLGGTGSRLVPCEQGHPPLDYFLEPHDETRVPRIEPAF